MNVCIVSPFYTENPNVSRPAFVRKSLQSVDINVFVITGDFSHTAKSYIDYNDYNIQTLPTIKYTKNTSLMRFVSHFILAFRLFFYAYKHKRKVDVFYVTAPFALTAYLIKLFCGKKTIIDIVDYWPNSLPFPGSLFLKPFLKLWEKFNYLFINRCDKVISVSSVFLELADQPKSNIILLSTEDNMVECFKRNNTLTIMYMGNIGRLYDFNTLVLACHKMCIPVHLEIVGLGDMKDLLLRQLDEFNISYNYHGVVFDRDKLRHIAEKVDLGFNGYINTNASFSYKASSYFSLGLPIVNSMNGDLKYFVEKHKIGINYASGDVDSLRFSLENYSENSCCYDANVKDFFYTNLDFTIVSEKVVKIFNEVI